MKKTIALIVAALTVAPVLALAATQPSIKCSIVLVKDKKVLKCVTTALPGTTIPDTTLTPTIPSLPPLPPTP